MAKLKYILYIDIGSWSAPVIGSGFISSDANIEKSGSGLNKDREEGMIFERVTYSGGVIFKGDEYDVMKTLSLTELKVGVKFYEGSTEIFEGIMNLTSGDFDDDSKVLTISIPESIDEYTEILKNLDKEVNAVSSAYTRTTLNFTTQTIQDDKFEVDTGAPLNLPTNYVNCPVGTPDAWASGVDYVSVVNGFYTYDWVLEGLLSYRCILNHTSSALNQPPNALYWANDSIFVYSQQRTIYKVAGYVLDESLQLYVKGACSPETIVMEFNRFRNLYTILEALVTKADPATLITETGANGYCDYLTSNPDLNIFIADKLDVKNYLDTDSEAFGYISLERLLEIYKFIFQLDWIIESGYFKLKHLDNTSKTIIGLNATNYLNKNWTSGKSKFKYLASNEINKERWSFEKTNDLDFDSSPIEYDVPFDDELEYNLQDINTNMTEVIKDNSKTSDDGFVIAAATLVGVDYYIQEKVGLVSGISKMNAQLSLAQLLIDHHLVERPFDEGTVNGNLISLTKKRDREQEFTISIANPDDVDFDKLVKTDLADLEVYTLNINFDGSFALIKGRY